MKFGFKVQCLIIILVICSAMGFKQLHAKGRSAAIGKIDLHALILLHPSMKEYDTEKMAFKLDSKFVSKSLVKAQNQERLNLIEALKTSRSNLASELVSIHRNHDALLKKMSDRYLSEIEKLATGAALFNRKRYSIEENRVEMKYRAKLNSISVQLRNNEKKIKRLSIIRGGLGYTNPEETSKKIKNIIEDIKKHTKKIAAQKNIQIVLNYSNRMKPKAKLSLSVIPSDLNYSKVFQNTFPKELMGDTAAVSGYYGEVQSIVANWLTHGDNILEPYSHQLRNTDVFIGGLDLTSEVLLSIFRAQKIDKNLTNVVIKTTKEL